MCGATKIMVDCTLMYYTFSSDCSNSYLSQIKVKNNVKSDFITSMTVHISLCRLKSTFVSQFEMEREGCLIIMMMMIIIMNGGSRSQNLATIYGFYNEQNIQRFFPITQTTTWYIIDSNINRLNVQLFCDKLSIPLKTK